MQEKWPRSLEVLIRCRGRGVTANPAFSRPGVGRNKKGVVVGGHKIMVCVMSTSRDGSSHRVSLANTGLQRVRYIATIRYTITCR